MAGSGNKLGFYFLLQLFRQQVYITFGFADQWAFRLLAEGSPGERAGQFVSQRLGGSPGGEQVGRQGFPSSEATRMQKVKRSEQVLAALLHPP